MANHYPIRQYTVAQYASKARTVVSWIYDGAVIFHVEYDPMQSRQPSPFVEYFDEWRDKYATGRVERQSKYDGMWISFYDIDDAMVFKLAHVVEN